MSFFTAYLLRKSGVYKERGRGLQQKRCPCRKSRSACVLGCRFPQPHYPAIQAAAPVNVSTDFDRNVGNSRCRRSRCAVLAEQPIRRRIGLGRRNFPGRSSLRQQPGHRFRQIAVYRVNFTNNSRPHYRIDRVQGVVGALFRSPGLYPYRTISKFRHQRQRVPLGTADKCGHGTGHETTLRT